MRSLEQQACSRPRAFAQLFSPPGVCVSEYPSDPACSSSSCSRMPSAQRSVPGPVSLLCVTGWMLNPLLALGVQGHTGFPSPPASPEDQASRGTITEQGEPGHGPCPPGLGLGLSRTLGCKAGCEGQQARMGSWLFLCLQPALAKRSRWCRVLAGAPWLTSLAVILGSLRLSARRHFKARRRGLRAAVPPR